jgi:hypothetical protein
LQRLDDDGEGPAPESWNYTIRKETNLNLLHIDVISLSLKQ